MELKLAETMLKFITKACNKHRGLVIEKYRKTSGEVTYQLEWHDCG